MWVGQCRMPLLFFILNKFGQQNNRKIQLLMTIKVEKNKKKFVKKNSDYNNRKNVQLKMKLKLEPFVGLIVGKLEKTIITYKSQLSSKFSEISWHIDCIDCISERKTIFLENPLIHLNTKMQLKFQVFTRKKHTLSISACIACTW